MTSTGLYLGHMTLLILITEARGLQCSEKPELGYLFASFHGHQFHQNHTMGKEGQQLFREEAQITTIWKCDSPAATRAIQT